VAQLTQQVESLKEMMMISLLEKESATERLKAVSLTHDLAGPSEKVTTALLRTLNSDPNTNVRLAALDALQGYTSLAEVRAGLVHSITLQKSPLVQVALAELMVAIQEKSSVSALKKVMDQKATPKEVKEKIKKSIDVLI
jgi:HEAT repeat protein